MRLDPVEIQFDGRRPWRTLLTLYWPERRWVLLQAFRAGPCTRGRNMEREHRRNMIRTLCIAMLEPHTLYKKLELAGDYTSRLALMEEAKTLPVGAVWDYYCLKQGVPVGEAWLAEVKAYEKSVLSKRN